MEDQILELRGRLREIEDLAAIGAVLGWDQTTYMPPGGAPARGRQMAALGMVVHGRRTDPELGRMLERLQADLSGRPDDDDDVALVRVALRDFQLATRLPGTLIAEISEHSAQAYAAWARARQDGDFAHVAGSLERTLELSRRVADCFPGYEHIADPLIDMSDYGMRASSVRELFEQLRRELVPIVQTVTALPPIESACLHQRYPEPDQLAFGERVIRAFGYDFERGRQDKTLHPFCTTFSISDVRITTRVREDDLGDALFSTLHEAGHAMYEQGVSPAYEATPLRGGTSAGVHESQSRLWENLVGRSRPFWSHYYPQLQQAFPAQLGAVPLETFYRAINEVRRSLVRVDADELTYNLHVIIRFELELQLLEGRLAVADLPEAWRAAYARDLGVAPPDDRDGVLQDVHWYGGLIGGAFQGYTIGNVLSAQFYDAALAAHPGIPAEIGRGEFGTLHTWLREQIYQHGSRYTAPELIQRVTGGGLRIEPYIAYLRRKYSDIYQVAL